MYKALPAVGIAAIAALVLILGSKATPAEAATVVVTSNADSGPGTFRAAVQQANTNPSVTYIKFLTAGPITLQSPVLYSGTQSLTLSGLYNWTVIQGSSTWPCAEPLFASTGGGDLTLISLSFSGNWCGDGVRVTLPDVNRTVYITLNNVLMNGNDGNGLLIVENDQDCDSGDASINLNVLSSTFNGNSYYGLWVREYGSGSLTVSTKFSSFNDNYDADGLRASERCSGDLTVTTIASKFGGNDENGLRGDESQEGGVNATLSGLDATGNGDEGVDFDEDDDPFNPASIGTADDDRDNEDTASAADGPAVASCGAGGNLTLTVNGGRANDNGSDGFELGESGCGSVYATFNAMVVSLNQDDGFDIEERSGGDLEFTVGSATTIDNNGHGDSDGDGVRLSELEYGSLIARITSSTVRWNGAVASDGDGIEIAEDGYGDVVLNIALTPVVGNRDDGLDLTEGECGDLDATLVSSTVSLNADRGVEGSQDSQCGDDFGELTLIFTSVLGNGGNNIDLSGIVVN